MRNIYNYLIYGQNNLEFTVNKPQYRVVHDLPVPTFACSTISYQIRKSFTKALVQH